MEEDCFFVCAPLKSSPKEVEPSGLPGASWFPYSVRAGVDPATRRFFARVGREALVPSSLYWLL